MSCDGEQAFGCNGNISVACCLSRVKTVHVFKNYGLGRSPHVLGQASTDLLQIVDSLGASQGSLKYC